MKPFLSGRAQASANTLASLASVANAPGPLVGAQAAGHKAHNAASGHGQGPTVECVKQGDKVVRLIITCSCGERIEVECLYPAGG